MNDNGHPYAGSRSALLTRHGKERVIAPVFCELLAMHVEHVDSFDTDTLGTFTREVPRTGTQVEAARAKARLATEISGVAHGIGSEGAFHPDPVSGLFPWNTELVLFLDLSEAIEVHGWAGGPAHHHHALVSTPAELRAIAERWDFPGHAVTLRPDGQSHALILKDLFDWPTLEDAFAKALAAAASGRVFVESDLRAHANPTRMQLIGAAATDLAIRLRSRCPECRAPGFGREKRLDGLPCRECGTPTTETLGERWRCVRCSHHEDRRVNHGKTGDPAHCPFCNP